jgi:hypothetical protein
VKFTRQADRIGGNSRSGVGVKGFCVENKKAARQSLAALKLKSFLILKTHLIFGNNLFRRREYPFPL